MKESIKGFIERLVCKSSYIWRYIEKTYEKTYKENDNE